MRRLFAASLTLVVLSLASEIAAQPPEAPRGYRIGPKDKLRIRVLEEETLNAEPRVDDDGTIDLAYVGPVKVGGLSVSQATSRITKSLEKYLQRASVTIEILEYRSRPISVVGAVKKPGDLPFSGRWTLLQALTQAGGLADNHGDTVYVLRRADSGLRDQLAIDVDELMLGADPTLDIPVFANDFINVPAAVPLTVLCMGAVKQPGALKFKSTDRVTVLSAIAQAGGLTNRASNRILVKTQGSDGRSMEATVNFKQMLAGKEVDLELEDGDIVMVKESFF